MKLKLGKFERQIRILAGNAQGWPFLCDGSPFNCEIFLVGINPATDESMWRHWSVENGVNKNAWLQAYRQRRQFTPTRLRIERLVNAIAPAKALETNIFHHHSSRESHLRKEQRTTEVFDFLIKTLKPKIVFVHGGSAIRHMQRLVSKELIRGNFTTVNYMDTTFLVLAHNHLAYQWSYEKVDQVGHAIRDRWNQLRAIAIASNTRQPLQPP